MKIAICSINTPEILAYAQYTVLNIRSYCNINGYDFIESGIIDTSRHVSWSRIKLIENLLNEKENNKDKYDWVMWVDADVVVTNKSIKIENIIENYGKIGMEVGGIDYDIIMPKEDCCDYVINNGVFLIKNTEWSKNFLKKWYGQTQFLNQAWWDGSAFIHLYDNDPDVKMHTKLVKQRVMNSFVDAPSRAGQEGIWKDGDFIIHFAGYSNRDWLKMFAYWGEKNYVPTREQIPELLNKLGLNGSGVEIGVQKGIYSESILSRSNLSKLYLCDSWRHFNEDYRDIANVDNQSHERCFQETKQRLARFSNRIEILRMLSLEATPLFKDETLDFVYIDANHTYQCALDDIRNWYPKVKKGGLIAGHDYIDGNLPEAVFGVRSAVNEFFKKARCIFVTNEPWQSWYVIKE